MVVDNQNPKFDKKFGFQINLILAIFRLKMIDFHIMSLGAESFAINDYMVEDKKIQSLTKN